MLSLFVSLCLIILSSWKTLKLPPAPAPRSEAAAELTLPPRRLTFAMAWGAATGVAVTDEFKQSQAVSDFRPSKFRIVAWQQKLWWNYSRELLRLTKIRSHSSTAYEPSIPGLGKGGIHTSSETFLSIHDEYEGVP